MAISFRDHSVVLSEHILGELAEHYVGKFRATDEQAALVVETFRNQSEVVTPTSMPSNAFSDAADLPVQGTVAAAQADYLVTGDKDLLALGDYQGIPILSPREFYDRIRMSD